MSQRWGELNLFNFIVSRSSVALFNGDEEWRRRRSWDCSLYVTEEQVVMS